jgi:hypothetical protein
LEAETASTPTEPRDLTLQHEMLPKTLLVCLLDLIAVKSAFGWNHVSRAKFESFANGKELALVACKSPFRLKVLERKC